MDIYHNVLNKICELVEGKTSKAVDFKDLVKKMGFIGSYSEIYKFLSIEGWITDSPKADFVFLTHWGLAEVKKTASGGGTDNSSAEIKKEANRAYASAKDLTIMLENFAATADKESFSQIEKKIAELQASINNIKNI